MNINYEYYKVNEKTFFTYEEAYREYYYTNADTLWKYSTNEQPVVVHNKIIGL